MSDRIAEIRECLRCDYGIGIRAGTVESEMLADLSWCLAIAEAVQALPDDLPIAGNEMRGETWYCVLCGVYSTGRIVPVVHAPDCPWLVVRRALEDAE